MLVLSFTISGQHILAGIHGNQDYFYDFVPDKSLGFASGSGGTVTYSLDINNDGINDLIFGAQREVTNWDGNSGSFVISMNQTGFALEGFDSCFAIFDSTLQYHLYYLEAMAKSFSKYDTISNNAFWYPSKVYMGYSRGSVNKPWIYGYGCGSMMDTTQGDYYVGVRVVIPNDTLFGWVKIRATTNSVTIEEFACNLYSIGMHKNFNEVDVSIYPNPTNGQLTILNTRYDKHQSIVIIFNLLGEMILECEPDTEKTTIDLSDQPKGVYMCRISSNQGNVTKKIIIQ